MNKDDFLKYVNNVGRVFIFNRNNINSIVVFKTESWKEKLNKATPDWIVSITLNSLGCTGYDLGKYENEKDAIDEVKRIYEELL